MFLNPWERLVGPNRYLAEMLRYAPELAQKATVVLHEPGDSQEEYQYLGCRVMVWEEIAQIRGGVSWDNLRGLAKRHSLSLGRAFWRRPPRPDSEQHRALALGGCS